MELKDYLYDSIKAKKNQIEIIVSISDIVLDALIRTSARKAGVQIAYTMERRGNNIIIRFTYPGPDPSLSRKVPTAVEVRETPRETPLGETHVCHLNDNGSVDFVYELDVMKGNLLVIHSSYPNNIKRILEDYMFTVIGVSEGICSYHYEMTENSPYDVTVELTLKTHLPYNEFVRRIRLGEDKARNIARDLFRGARVPAELYCLVAMAYIQRNVKYDYDYMKNWKDMDQQKIDNHTCYGSLVVGKAVCEGYSWGLIKILRALGLEAVPVTGKRNGTGHEWTKVKINGEWYNLESTLDPNPEGILVAAFLVSDRYLRSCGYEFEPLKYQANNTKYESSIALRNLIANLFSKRDEYIRAGVSSHYLNLDYYGVSLK